MSSTFVNVNLKIIVWSEFGLFVTDKFEFNFGFADINKTNKNF